MKTLTQKDIEPYIGKVVTIINKDNYPYYKERVIAFTENQVVTEYRHWLKTPEDGLLREHWIPVEKIKSITIEGKK
jgi:hypothetical protein